MYAIKLYNLYIGRVVAVLAAIIAVSIFIYGAFLLGAVAHAAGRTAAEGKIRTLSTSVSQLESQYLAETRALSQEKAAALGFVAPVAVETVYANNGSALTLR